LSPRSPQGNYRLRILQTVADESPGDGSVLIRRGAGPDGHRTIGESGGLNLKEPTWKGCNGGTVGKEKEKDSWSQTFCKEGGDNIEATTQNRFAIDLG